jgi:osmoprotectant transport system ATP-binding protein
VDPHGPDASTSSPVIELRGAARRYGGVEALRPTTLSLGTGVSVLLGESGSGKSTLLRLLTGLVAPTSGEVRLWGEVVSQRSTGPLRRRLGYVIQDGGLFPHLTAADNVALAARYFGWSAERAGVRLEELRALTHLPADAMVRFPSQLSGGQRQRVGLMRALMLGPELLLLDEPLGALDPMIRAELRSDLREIFRRLGQTVVLVTHDLAEAAFFADRVVLLRDGSVVQQGTMTDLIERPADPFVTRFIGAQSAPPLSGARPGTREP